MIPLIPVDRQRDNFLLVSIKCMDILLNHPSNKYLLRLQSYFRRSIRIANRRPTAYTLDIIYKQK